MENRPTQAEIGINTSLIGGLVRDVAKAVVDTSKIVVEESMPELEEGIQSYESVLQFLERKSPHYGEEEADHLKLSEVRTELAALETE